MSKEKNIPTKSVKWVDLSGRMLKRLDIKEKKNELEKLKLNKNDASELPDFMTSKGSTVQ